MRIVLQRVSRASVAVGGKKPVCIGAGYVLLIGIGQDDSEKDIDFLVNKIINMRLFENADNKFDKSLKDIDGDVLIISQFTLFADYNQGRRPYFGEAADPKMAKELYEKFIDEFKVKYDKKKVKSGVFAAKMAVELINDGPVTMILDSKF